MSNFQRPFKKRFNARNGGAPGAKKGPFMRRPGYKNNARKTVKPSSYAFTVSIAHDGPALCSISMVNDPGALPGSFSYTLTPLGEHVWREIYLIPGRNINVKVTAAMLMPHRADFIVWAPRWKVKEIELNIADFLDKCSAAYREMPGVASNARLFRRISYRIIRRPEQVKAAAAAIADAPRRSIILSRTPDLFKRYLHLRIGSKELAAYGNIFLLRDFDRQQVVVHRADSFDTRRAHNKQWLMCAANGGVLVSPFISRDEKAIRDQALKSKGRLIIVRPDGAESQLKPSDAELKLCSAGRLLLLAPWPGGENPMAGPFSRQKALLLNSFAAAVAKLPIDAPLALIRE